MRVLPTTHLRRPSGTFSSWAWHTQQWRAGLNSSTSLRDWALGTSRILDRDYIYERIVEHITRSRACFPDSLADGAADCLAYAGIRIGGQRGSGCCGKADLGQRTAHWGGAGLVEFSVVAARVGWAGGGFAGAGWSGEAARSAGRVLCGGVPLRLDSPDCVCYF